ncbi:MAG: hypothetical protein MOB07_13040 [Acidobacteria bacterium]|nr:hypothetical protein [Acidobacteriota bacterium]
MKRPFDTNSSSPGVGVSNPLSPNIGPETGEDFSGLKYVDIEAASPPDGEKEKPSGAKRRKLIRGLAVLATLALVVIGFFFWIATSGRKKIDLAVRDQNAQAEQPTPQKGDDVTAQAIAEVRGAAASPDPATETAAARDTAPVTIPLGGTVTAVESAPEPNTSGASAGAPAKPPEIVSRRNTERSIRCAPVPKPVAPPSKRPPAAPDASRAARGATPSLPASAEKTVTLPPFGAMLPVRTLGALYTLRPSFARLELTRDAQGQGWRLKKGTVLIGQQRGSEFDRAYVSLTGFIDPDSGRLVRLAGDALGADGAPGLQGKRRQISSRWARVLSRAASAAISLGQAALSRGGVVVNLPGAVSPELQGLSPSAIDRREFVEVPAGATAFVLVTDLPKETRGVDPQPVAENDGGGPSLGDDELANLLTGGTPEEIRAALPRMTPELRRIAEAVLRESSDSDVAEGSSERKR